MLTADSGSRPALSTGTRVGSYRIVAAIGAGANGEVYRARDLRLDRDVALKLLPAGDPARRDQIEREARIVASLNHPNVLAIHDIGVEQGAMYIVTELVDGESLRGARLPLRTVLDIAAQIADALSAAHAAGVIHRDLKPDNVMVNREGRVKLLDFGVATSSRLPADLDETVLPGTAGVVTGTVGYMAPEQIRAGAVDARADIFSFGALAYELLTGLRAFAGETAADVLAAVLTADPPPLPASLPAAVREIVLRCVDKRPEQRFQSARDLAFALRQAAAGERASSQPPAAPPSATAVREQLARLTASAGLANAERLSSLLRFVVEETLHGRGWQLKEARIGLEVFGRKADSYDPAFDPIVRVQMGRLRTKLRAYYGAQGAADRIRIDIPVGSYTPTFENASGAAHVEGAAPTVVDDLRIAVLPIVNMSPDADNQYFCDGLTEELINRLAQVPQLRVVARTSSFQFKDAARDIREVGRLLDASKVLEGSVRKAGNRIRATMQLINVADGCHVWSERYEGDLTDIFAIHEQISAAVQRALQMKMLGGDARPASSRPPSIEAYNHYLQGRFLWKKRTEQGLRAALDHFDQAVSLEPLFARAFSGVADCHVMLSMSAADAPERCMPNAAAAAGRALQLDDRLAEAHASLAAVRNCYEWDLAAAERGYRRAIELDASYATAFHWLGLWVYATQRKPAAAVECLEQAIELDPLSPPIIADAGLARAFEEQFDAAQMYCRRALELDPHFHRPFWFLGLIFAWSGDYAAAESALLRGLELCPGAAFRSRLLGALGFMYGRWGKRDRVDEIKQQLDGMRQHSYVPAFEAAQIEMGLGNLEQAVALLEDGVAKRDSYAVFLNAWLSFKPLRGHPAFRRLLARIGLES
jgi:serine/threonine-protein kinase